MNDGYDGGDSYDGSESTSMETSSESIPDFAEESSAYESSVENISETYGDVETKAEADTDSSAEGDAGEELSAFVEDDTSSTLETKASTETNETESTTSHEGEKTTIFEEGSSSVEAIIEKNTEGEEKDEGDESSAFREESVTRNGENKETDYSRPTHWRSGMRDEVWENAKDEHGRVRDPVTGRYMSKDQAWDMGHKPGYELYKHQESAKERGISRQEFLDEYYNSDHYRPELPSSNRSHKGENVTDEYFGD